MNWNIGFLGMLSAPPPIRIIRNRGFRLLAFLICCYYVFYVVRSIVKWFTRASRDDLLILTKELKRIISFLSICTGILLIALCIVGIAGVSIENVALLAVFLKMGYCTLVFLCITCAVAHLLFLIWAIYAASRCFARTKCHWLRHSFHKDSPKEAVEQKS